MKYEAIETDIMASIYIIPSHKEEYAKQLALIDEVEKSIKAHGYEIDEYVPQYQENVFLLVDRKHKKCHWSTFITAAVFYCDNKKARPIPLRWFKEAIDIVLDPNTDQKYLNLLEKLAMVEFDIKIGFVRVK